MDTDNYSKAGLYAETTEMLLSRAYKVALAKQLSERDRSALDTADWLAATIFWFDGPLHDSDGQRIEITHDLIDRAFGYEDDDAFDEDCGFELIDSIKGFANKMPKRCSQKRHLMVFTLLDLAFKIIGKPVKTVY